MKTVYSSLFLLFFDILSVTAQTNFLANNPNAYTPGQYNTIVGPQAGNNSSTGANNVIMGHNAGVRRSDGSFNVFVGEEAGKSDLGSSGNVFIGPFTGVNSIFNVFNVSIGNSAGYGNQYGSLNINVGSRAGYTNINGGYNIMLGDSSGYNNQMSNNIFIGSKTGYSNINGEQNTFLGYQSGYNNTASGNTFFGYRAGLRTTSGQANVFIGSNAGFNNMTGTGNMFVGQAAGFGNITGSYNLFMGNSAGQTTDSGSGNTAIGDGSALRNTSGSGNTAIGRYAGENNVTGTDNVFIGINAGVPYDATNLTNATAIGARARVSQSNSIVLGANANVGVGNSAPSAKLHITSGAANTSGLRLENLTSSSPASATSQYKFLTVDGSGNVILGSLNGSAREAASESLWQRKGQFLESALGEAVIIGQGVSKTSSDYNLFVSKGILTEKVKVALKNTDEWSDKVFESGYVLKSLGEVEQHIKQRGHLPGVPSAREMVEQGNDLHKTDAKLLEKIEELTLYSIEQQKRIAKLERMVEELLQHKKKEK